MISTSAMKSVWSATVKWAEQIISFNDGDASVDVSSNPITPNLASSITSCKSTTRRASLTARRTWATASSRPARCLVGKAGDPNDEGYSRYGARPTMVLMTDGQSNHKAE